MKREITKIIYNGFYVVTYESGAKRTFVRATDKINAFIKNANKVEKIHRGYVDAKIEVYEKQ